MKLSIKGIISAWFLSLFAALVLILPPAFLFDEVQHIRTPSTLFLLYMIGIGVLASILGREAFDASAVVLAGVSSLVNDMAQRVLAKLVGFVVMLALLYVGRMFIKS